jgi:hypothetical protein
MLSDSGVDVLPAERAFPVDAETAVGRSTESDPLFWPDREAGGGCEAPSRAHRSSCPDMVIVTSHTPSNEDRPMNICEQGEA